MEEVQSVFLWLMELLRFNVGKRKTGTNVLPLVPFFNAGYLKLEWAPHRERLRSEGRSEAVDGCRCSWSRGNREGANRERTLLGGDSGCAAVCGGAGLLCDNIPPTTGG